MPRALVFYHYLHPDDVVSAVHFTGLCVGLRERGWDVEAVGCNRACRNDGSRFPSELVYQGVRIRHAWRPGFRQSAGAGRLLNAAWMIARWCGAALERTNPDVVIVGSDPILSVLVAPFWKTLRPHVPVAHWCFDLYPEAAIAAGLLAPSGIASRTIEAAMGMAYRNCDLIADLGPCMRRRLERYNSPARKATLVPWALAEPPGPVPADPVERGILFGNARLGLLYSGTLGRAHSFEPLLRLARQLRKEPVALAFGVRGNSTRVLAEALAAGPCGNVRIAPFVTAERLENRLAAADIHVVTLRQEWTGTVVPSKFFGALAIGRPVLFVGSRQSSIARWIEEHRLGWVLEDGTSRAVQQELTALAGNPERLMEMFSHCHRVYRDHFARRLTLGRWNLELTDLVRLAAPAAHRNRVHSPAAVPAAADRGNRG